MENKCSKYEGLFVFSDEETLKKHLEECEECRLEQEKMDKVSDLISEVKFLYRSKRRTPKLLKAVCGFMIIMFFMGTYSVVSYSDDLSDALMYGNTLSAEDLGFPVDSYGLLMVD